MMELWILTRPLLFIQIATGIILAIHYTSNIELALSSLVGKIWFIYCAGISQQVGGSERG